MAFIELEPRTNVLALVSFVLSLIAIGNQAASYLSGPKTSIHPPTTIAIRKVPTGATSKLDLYATAIGFTNTADSGYPEIVTNVAVEFAGPDGQPVQLRWWAFEQAADAVVSDFEKFNETKAISTTPQVVPGGGAVGWSTILVPYPKSCSKEEGAKCSPGQNFLTLNEDLASWAAKGGIEFRFSAQRLSSRKELVATCKTPRQNPAQADISLIAQDFLRRGWITLSCEREPVAT